MIEYKKNTKIGRNLVIHEYPNYLFRYCNKLKIDSLSHS